MCGRLNTIDKQKINEWKNINFKMREIIKLDENEKPFFE